MKIIFFYFFCEILYFFKKKNYIYIVNIYIKLNNKHFYIKNKKKFVIFCKNGHIFHFNLKLNYNFNVEKIIVIF